MRSTDLCIASVFTGAFLFLESYLGSKIRAYVCAFSRLRLMPLATTGSQSRQPNIEPPVQLLPVFALQMFRLSTNRTSWFLSHGQEYLQRCPQVFPVARRLWRMFFATSGKQDPHRNQVFFDQRPSGLGIWLLKNKHMLLRQVAFRPDPIEANGRHFLLHLHLTHLVQPLDGNAWVFCSVLHEH